MKLNKLSDEVDEKLKEEKNARFCIPTYVYNSANFSSYSGFCLRVISRKLQYYNSVMNEFYIAIMFILGKRNYVFASVCRTNTLNLYVAEIWRNWFWKMCGSKRKYTCDNDIIKWYMCMRCVYFHTFPPVFQISVYLSLPFFL